MLRFQTLIFQGFLRSLSLHLQICWKVVPSQRFFWGSVLAGCAVPLTFSFTAYAVTGVSNRFGTSCHINHKDGLKDYWGPLLALAALSTILQFTTFGYCVKVYIRSLLDDSTSSDNVSGLPTYNSSVRTVTAKQAYRRVKKVVALQWRGILIVLIIVANVTFLSIIFVSMDNNIQAVRKDYSKAEPWLLCLVIHHGDKNQCLNKVGGLAQDEASVMAALVLLSVCRSMILRDGLKLIAVVERLLVLYTPWSHLDDLGLDDIHQKQIQPVSRLRLGRRSTKLQRTTKLRNDRLAPSNGLQVADR